MSKKYPHVLLIAVLIIVVFVYVQSLSFDFVYDDNDLILNNKWLTSASYTGEILSSHAWGFAGDTAGSHFYRPLMHLTYMAVYQLFGPAPAYFHGLNVVIHLLNTVLIFLIVIHLTIVERSRYVSRGIFIAAIAALLFGIHPINTESVAWVATFTELVYTFFLFMSFYVFLKKGDRWTGMTTALVLFFLALLSKETAMALVLIIPLYLFIYRRDNPQWVRNFLPFVIVAAFYMTLRTYVVGSLLKTASVEADSLTTLLNVSTVFIRYMEKLVYPADLSIIYETQIVSAITDTRFLVSVVALAVIGAIAYFRHRDKLFLIALAIMVIPLLPVLYVPAVSTGGFADRYLYLPSVGFAIILATVLAGVSQKRPAMWSAGAVFIVLTSLYFSATSARLPVWQDDVSLFSDAAIKNPNNALVRNNLGNAYLVRERTEEAVVEYREALRINPEHIESLFNLAFSYEKLNRYAEATLYYERFIKLAPANFNAHKNTAAQRIDFMKGRF